MDDEIFRFLSDDENEWSGGEDSKEKSVGRYDKDRFFCFFF
jgi:hypothetical protein